MSWLSPTTLLGIVLGYLVFLFVVASAGEGFSARLTRGRLRTLTYVLAASVDFTKRQTGLMTAVVVESIVKLLAFLVVGVYVTWGLFDGFGDLFGRIASSPEWSRLLTLGQPPTASYARWTAMLIISMMAVMFLPRQFHVLVVQNSRVRDVNAVSWSFPLYLLLSNLFVLPIAYAGLLVFPEAGAEAD